MMSSVYVKYRGDGIRFARVEVSLEKTKQYTICIV